MSRKVITCRPDDNVRTVMRTMTTRRFRHMPVVGDDGSLMGIVSIGDVVKHHIDELELETSILRDVATAHH
jgi:predicted transcriptional regulator